MSRPVFGLVLAGGKSRRMGQDKATLTRGGSTQLAHVVALLEAHVDKVFVSTREDQDGDAERARFARIVDSVDAKGPMAGILSAQAAHPSVDWLVVACDLPNVDSETLTYLLQQRSESAPFTAYNSSHDGLPEPLCAIYRQGSDTVLQSFVARDISCPRKALINSDTKLLQLPNMAALDNINTPEDLQGSVLKKAL